MSVVWFTLLLLLQLAAQPAQLAAISTPNAAQQQELVGTLSSTNERQLTQISSGFGSRRTFGGLGRGAPTPRGGIFGGTRLPGRTRLPGGFSGYGRSGFRSTPFILPLALGSGLLAGSAISSLRNNPNAYCNGVSVQCYKAACEDALRNRCPDAAAESNNTLLLTACPDPRYSECYETPNFNNTASTSFECFGVRRPRYGREDLAAVCHQPGFDDDLGFYNGAAAARLSKVLYMLLPSALGVLLLLGV